MLLIADVHLGKVSHFRKHGAAVPIHASFRNLEKLTQVVNDFSPKTICFLGDLFHSDLNQEWEDFTQWVHYTTGNIVLVAGNHDIIAATRYTDLDIEVIDDLTLEGFHLSHHPSDTQPLFNLAGHIHPGVRLQGVGRQTIKLPCFFRRKNQMILPAFGTFTGNYILKPTEEDVVYAIVDQEVTKLH